MNAPTLAPERGDSDGHRGPERVRLFVAVALPPAATTALRRRLKALPEPRPRARWTPPEQWHFTLRFVGETHPTRLRGLTEAIDGERPERTVPIALRLGELGAFPNPRRARVLWSGVDRGGEDLERLAELVERAARAAGFGPADRTFRPHLTLARLKEPASVRHVIDAVGNLGIEARIARLDLMRSRLLRGGAEHTLVRSWPLGALDA